MVTSAHLLRSIALCQGIAADVKKLLYDIDHPTVDFYPFLYRHYHHHRHHHRHPHPASSPYPHPHPHHQRHPHRHPHPHHHFHPQPHPLPLTIAIAIAIIIAIAIAIAIALTHPSPPGACLLPMALRFVLLPAPLLLLPGTLGSTCFRNALLHLLIADVLSNLHAFLTIVTNHAGSDLYRFSTGCSPHSPTFMLRQVLSSANYRTGGDVNDFLHGFLNYQVEHHIWPTLSMLSYQKAQPELQAICEAHGVPYVQESVWRRLVRTIRIMIGDTSMREWPGHPGEDEPPEVAAPPPGVVIF